MTLTCCAVQVPAACRTRGGYNIIEEAAFGSHFLSESCFFIIFLFLFRISQDLLPGSGYSITFSQPSGASI